MRIIEKSKPLTRKEISRRYAARHKKENAARLKAWRKKNPDKVRAQSRRLYLTRPEHFKKLATNNLRKREYGLSTEQFNLEVLKRNNLCDICRKKPGGKGCMGVLHIDHKPGTKGTFRGLLCGKCNVGLGAFSDDVSILENAIRYLLP